MGMKASLQQKIAPAIPRGTVNLSDAKVPDSPTAVKSRTSDPEQFLSILQKSNRDVKSELKARENGDLSGAGSYEDFLQELNRRTQTDDTPRNSLDKNDFLRLFVTQLQEQDPLNPKDGAEMASQLAQFNGLEQMMNINTAMERLADAQSKGQSIHLINYVGKEVTVSGGRVNLTDGKTNAVDIQLEKPIGGGHYEVRDKNGKVIYKEDLGPQPKGRVDLQWNGQGSDGQPAANGIYHISVHAQAPGGDSVEVPISSKVKISGVDLASGGGSFYSNVGRLDLGEITAVGDTGFDVAAKKQNDMASVAADPGSPLGPDTTPTPLAGGGAGNTAQLTKNLENAIRSSSPPPSRRIPVKGGPSIAKEPGPGENRETQKAP